MKQIRTRKEINELCESIIKLYEGEEYIEKPVDIAGLATKYFKLKVYMVNFAVASSAIKHTIRGDANITDDVDTIKNLMDMNYDIKR